MAALVKLVADLPHEVGIGGHVVDDDGAGTREHCRCIREALGDELLRELGRVSGCAGEYLVDELLQPGFAGDGGLGAASGLVRQVQILETSLRGDLENAAAEFVGQLALLLDAAQDRGLAILELSQVVQLLLEGAQLGVVETTGDFLAVAGDEGDSGAFIEQGDGCSDAGRIHRQFAGNGLRDLFVGGGCRCCLRGVTGWTVLHCAHPSDHRSPAAA